MRVTTGEIFRACEVLGVDYATKQPTTVKGIPQFDVDQILAVTTVVPGKGQVVLARYRYVGNYEWERVD